MHYFAKYATENANEMQYAKEFADKNVILKFQNNQYKYESH